MSLAYCIVKKEGFCLQFLMEIEYEPLMRSVVYILEDMDDLALKHKMFIEQNFDEEIICLLKFLDKSIASVCHKELEDTRMELS